MTDFQATMLIIAASSMGLLFSIAFGVRQIVRLLHEANYHLASLRINK